MKSAENLQNPPKYKIARRNTPRARNVFYDAFLRGNFPVFFKTISVTHAAAKSKYFLEKRKNSEETETSSLCVYFV